jgi:hypothetical protein
MKPRIYADLQSQDDDNRVRLDAAGTRDDLARLGLQLTDGLQLTLYSDDADESGHPDELLVDGVARLGDGRSWVAEVDWASVRHASDETGTAGANGHPAGTQAKDQIA